MEKELKTAAAYIRVSTDRQTELSPDSQLRIIKEYAKQNGYNIPSEYIFREDGLSGKYVKKRPQFIEMIGLAKQKPAPFSTILVWKFSRFARNQEESIVYKSMLKKNDVSVISCSETLDEENPFSSLIERIIEWMDEYYSIRLSGEVLRGMSEKVKRGQPVTIPSFGYDIVDKQYVINEEKAAIVRKIFTDYIDGKSSMQIASELNEIGVKTTRGNPFENRTIDYILKNPVYIGKIRWNQNGKTDYRYSNNKDIVYTQGVHKSIVSDEIFYKVQNLIEANGRKQRKGIHNNIKQEYMLHGLIKCSNCGSALAYSNKGLQCIKYSKSICKQSHYINLTNINNLVILGLEQVFENKDFKLSVKSLSQTVADCIDYTNLIEKENQKIQRIKNAYLEGIYTVEEVKEYKKSVEDKIKNLSSRQVQLKQEKTKPRKENVKEKKNFLATLKSPAISEKEKNEILKSFVDCIVFNRSTSSVDIFLYI